MISLKGVFETELGKDYTLTIDNIKDSATDAELKAVINAIVATNVLAPAGNITHAISAQKIIVQESVVL